MTLFETAAPPLVTGEHIREALAHASKPESAKWIAKQLPPPLRKESAAVEAAIQAEIAAGRLFEHPPSRGQARYFGQSVEQLAAAELQRKIESAKTGLVAEKSALTLLKKSVGPERAAALLQELADRGEVHRHPPVTGKTINYALTPLDPREYIAKPVAKLEQELQKLSDKLGLPLADLQRAAAGMLAPSAGDGPGVDEPQPAPAALPADAILQAMRDINPRVDTGDVVSIPELRSRLAFQFETKAEFDRCLLGLAEQWRVTLHFYNQAEALDEAERLPLVEDERGRCYNVVSLRRST